MKGPYAANTSSVRRSARQLSRSLMIAVASMVLAGCAPDRSSSPLTHSGRWLIDVQGRVVIVHGINMVNKLPPYTPQSIGFDEDDAAFLESNGFNAVRLGVIWKAVEPLPGIYDSGYVAQIKATQQLLASHNIYSLIDWHQDEYSEVFGGEGFPEWAVDTGGIAPLSPPLPFPQEYSGDPAQKAAWDNLYANAPAADGIGLADHLAAAEAYVAGQFSNEPEVLGYDMINEPSQGNLDSSMAESSAIGPLEQKLLSSIRRVDHIHLAFYEPSIYYALNGGTSLPTFNDANAGMSFHDYCFEPSASTEPSFYEQICGPIFSLYQNLAIKHVQSTQDALLNTEFGSAYSYVIEQVTELADLNMIPWINWAYCACGDPTTALQPLDLEGIVNDPAEPLTGSNLNTSHLNALVRPYPQVIAGTPENWSYDTTTGTFRLAWSTTSPPGVLRATDANTVVFLPSLDYPHGYQVSVDNGTVVSGIGTQYLAIAADSGASSVKVTISRK